MSYICAGCRKEIFGQWLETDGLLFHPECFVCDVCGAQLPGTFHNHGGKRVCENCLPTRVCKKCGKEITGEGVEADGALFHPECFTCDKCKALLSGPYHPVNGLRYCEKCIERHSCSACGKEVTDTAVEAGGLFFHRECFKCNACGSPLATQFYPGPAGQFLCKPTCTGGSAAGAPPAVAEGADRDDEAARSVRFATDVADRQEVGSGEARRIYNLIDPEGTGDVSKLAFLHAMEKQEVNQYVCPELDGEDALKHEHVFDSVCALFDRIADGRRRFGPQEFCTYFGEAAAKLRRKTMQLTGSRALRRVLIIGPGFGRELNPRQGKLVEQAGFNVHWCVNLPNPESPNFPLHQFLGHIKADIDLFRPDAVVAASKGGAYVTGLWQAGLWAGPTLIINAHPSLTRLPPKASVVLAHGANDEVYGRPRAELEQIMASGSPNRTLLYYTGNSGPMPGGRLTRMGDMHNMESLLHYQTLPRLIDAILSSRGPEVSLHESWRDRITDQRLVAEQWLGHTPELLKRFWVSSNQAGMDERKLFEVPPGSPEFEQVLAVFRSQPREPPMYCGLDPALWTSANILKIERVENGQQLEGNAKPNYEALRKSIEDQGMAFEPGLHTRWAFHGSDAVDSVVSNPMQGFQPLASGTRGSTVWGLGTYFARDAKYVSDGGFCPVSPNGISTMLMCLLMTGMSCLGDPGHRGVLPMRQKPHRYNSSVDSLSSPEIYIIQHPGAAYPGYLITFQKP